MYKTFALPEIMRCEISQILSRLAPPRIIIARTFGIYESIGEARERETRRKSSIRVIRARRLTNDCVIASLNHASADMM